MRVEIKSRKLISPSTPTPSHLQKLKLSSVDQISYPGYFPVTLYYPYIFPGTKQEGRRSSGDGDDQERKKNISINDDARRLSEQMQKALSETLTLFYPLAGRKEEEEAGDVLFIDCSDKGVEYLEAHVTRSSAGCYQLDGGDQEWDQQYYCNHQDLFFYNPAAVVLSADRPLLTVQFNVLDNGIAIGICVSHTVADGFTLFSFIRAWASITLSACQSGGDLDAAGSYANLSQLCPPRDAISNIEVFSVSSISTLDDAGPGRGDVVVDDYDNKAVTRRLVFDAETISKLRSSVWFDTNNDEERIIRRQPTRVELVTGVIWRALVMVAKVRHGCFRPSLLSHSFNMRGKTHLVSKQNGQNNLGNFSCLALAEFAPTAADDAATTNTSAHEFVYRVHTALTNTAADIAKASNGDELFSLVSNGIRKLNESNVRRREVDNIVDLDVFAFTSWCRFPVYEANFGWGKPDFVTSLQLPINVGMLLDTKDAQGIEAWIGLHQDFAALFHQNLDILSS